MQCAPSAKQMESRLRQNWSNRRGRPIKWEGENSFRLRSAEAVTAAAAIAKPSLTYSLFLFSLFDHKVIIRTGPCPVALLFLVLHLSLAEA